jgi:hypothetical protein
VGNSDECPKFDPNQINYKNRYISRQGGTWGAFAYYSSFEVSGAFEINLIPGKSPPSCQMSCIFSLSSIVLPSLDSVDIELAKSFPAFFEEQNLMSHRQENVKALKLSKSPLGHKERDKDEAPGIQVTVIGWAARHEVAMNNRPWWMR